jgi:hypothetical protein
MARKSQIRKMPHLRKVCKSKKMLSENFRICDLPIFADRQPLSSGFYTAMLDGIIFIIVVSAPYKGKVKFG